MTDFYVFADDKPQIDDESGQEYIQLAERASGLEQMEAFEADPEFIESAEYAEGIGRPVSLYKLVRVRTFGGEKSND